MYGQLDFAYGDYLIIPRGTIYQINFTTEQNRLFIVESFSPIRFPKNTRANTASCWNTRLTAKEISARRTRSKHLM